MAMKTVLPSLLAALVLVALCAASVRSSEVVYDYALKVNPPQITLSLALEDGVTTLSGAELGNGNLTQVSLPDFSIPFYNDTINEFHLNANGFIIFGEIYGDEARLPAPSSDVCPFPIPPHLPGQENLPAFHKGFAFAWSDYDWTTSNTSSVYYKLFAAGSCPYAPKKNESCFVVQFIQAPYYWDGTVANADPGTLGNVTAIVFESGDVMSQVVTSTSSKWGVNEYSKSVGVVFGISYLELQQGVTFPGAVYCNVTNTAGIDAVAAAGIVQPGDTFGFYISAPCGEKQSLRSDGLGCKDDPSPAAPLAAAAWLQTLRSLTALF